MDPDPYHQRDNMDHQASDQGAEKMALMDPAFQNRDKGEIQEARMELRGSMILVFLHGKKLISQIPLHHPAVDRHLMQTEQIFHVKISNRDWMMREIHHLRGDDLDG